MIKCFNKKTFSVAAAVLILAIGGFLFWLSDKHTVPIMMYHQVIYREDPQSNWVSPQNFEWQMAYLAKHNYHVIPLSELVAATKAGRTLPRKSVVITFDDGYENNYFHAYRILKKYGFPAIIFVPSDQVSNADGYLKWEQIREMIAGGIDIGSHTRTEAYLPDLTVEQQRDEIRESKRILERNLGIPIDYFAYPIGGFSEEIKDITRGAGYKAACATNRGYDPLNKDVYELNRIRFSDKDNRPDYLWIKLSGFYNLFRKAKHPY